MPVLLSNVFHRKVYRGTMICHHCGAAMTRGIRPMTINYKGLSATFDMPGWYCVCGEGVVTGEDMDMSDHYLNLLKTQAENLSAL